MKHLNLIIIVTIFVTNSIGFQVIADSESKYPASEFVPYSLYQDPELIRTLSSDDESTTTSPTELAKETKSDANEPAHEDEQQDFNSSAYFEPVVLYQDRALIEELSRPEPLPTKTKPNRKSADPFGEPPTRPVSYSEPSDFPRPGLLIILAIALLAGTIWKSKVTRAQEQPLSSDDTSDPSEDIDEDESINADVADIDSDDLSDGDDESEQLKTPN